MEGDAKYKKPLMRIILSKNKWSLYELFIKN